MKKLMMISLLLLVAVFQSAFAQSDLYPFSENKPCEGIGNIDWKPFVISFEKECNGKTCYAIVEFYTKTFYSRHFGNTYGYEITGLAFADKDGNPCGCSENDIISEAVIQINNWLAEHTQKQPGELYTASSIKTCYEKDIADFDATKVKKELDQTHSKLPPYLDNKKTKVGIISQKSTNSVKLPYLKPCGKEECCIAYYEVIWNISEEGLLVYGGFKFLSYESVNDPKVCLKAACKDACAGLKVDHVIESQKSTHTTIAPSPNDGSFSAFIPPIEKPSVLVLYNSYGTEIHRVNIEPNKGVSRLSFNLNCQSGTYIFKLIEDGFTTETGSFSVVK